MIFFFLNKNTSSLLSFHLNRLETASGEQYEEGHHEVEHRSTPGVRGHSVGGLPGVAVASRTLQVGLPVETCSISIVCVAKGNCAIAEVRIGEGIQDQA